MLVSGQNKFAVLRAGLEMSNRFYDQVTEELKNITASGLYKKVRESECNLVRVTSDRNSRKLSPRLRARAVRWV